MSSLTNSKHTKPDPQYIDICPTKSNKGGVDSIEGQDKSIFIPNNRSTLPCDKTEEFKKS